MRSASIGWDYQDDKVYGVDVLTHSTEHERAWSMREVALITLMLGKLWIHVNLFADKDDEDRVPRSWGITYEPGYGWLNSFGEKQIESLQEIFTVRKS